MGEMMNLAAETHLKGDNDTGVKAVPRARVGGGPSRPGPAYWSYT